MKVLIIAEACNPEWTSVPLIGWSLSLALEESKDVDIHLATQVRNEDAIIRSGRIPVENCTFIDSEWITAPLYRISSTLRGGSGRGWTTVTAFSALAYPFFERSLWRRFKKRIRSREFDVVHRITPLSPTSPSLLARKCEKAGVPFVLGPLNGGVPWPELFQQARREEREWLSYVRGFYKLLPGYRSTRRCASAMLIGSMDTWKQMDHRYHQKCIYMPENGINPELFDVSEVHRGANKPLKAVFVGRLVPYKGADMAMEAAAPFLDRGELTLDIFGDGPEFEKLESLRKTLGVPGVTLHGFTRQKDLSSFLKTADVLAFPSIREFGGGVVLEAMAMGVVPIVVDYGGPGELVTGSTGYKIPLGPRESIIRNLRDRLESLVEDPAPVDAMRTNGYRRISEFFTWKKKAERIHAVYRWITDTGGEKPDFGYLEEGGGHEG